MTIFQKLINKFKKLFGKEQSQPIDQVESVEIDSRKPKTKIVDETIYSEKSREDALKFQDECNNELFWNDN